MADMPEWQSQITGWYAELKQRSRTTGLTVQGSGVLHLGGRLSRHTDEPLGAVWSEHGVSPGSVADLRCSELAQRGGKRDPAVGESHVQIWSLGSEPHDRVAVQRHGPPANGHGHSFGSDQSRQMLTSPGEQVIGVGLAIVFGQAFLIALADHQTSVRALPEVNFAAAIPQRGSVYHGDVA